jgi:peptide deformylase
MIDETKPTEEIQPPELIITPGDLRFPLLEMKSQLCDIPLSAEDAAIVERMKELLITMGENAVGLAGTQIGITKCVFIMKCKDGTIIECINPIILNQSADYSNKFEGCLSLPKVMFKIKRPKEITLSYFDSMGANHTRVFSGIDAKIVAHEMDHLNGRLISCHAERALEKHERLIEEQKRIKKAKKERRRKLSKMRR